MRVKLLRDDDGVTVRLVYPSTLDEYGEAIETLGALAVPAGDDGPNVDGDVDVAIHVSYVVTTESQRAGWQLADLCSSGGARVVDESEAFGLLRTPTAAPPPRWDSGPDGALSEALRALGGPDTRLEQVFEALGRVDLPGGVCETLRRELRRALAARTVGKVVDRAQRVLRLPWCRRSPARWDAAGVSLALERAHGGHGRARSRLVEALAACPQSSGLLTVEGARDGRGVAAAGAPLALVVRPAAAASPVPCLVGPPGVGKTSLAAAASAALGRARVQVMLGGQDVERLLHGVEDDVAGRIVEGLCETGVNNLVFILEGVDRVDDEAAGVLLDVLDPQRRRAFQDAYLDVPFDLCDVLWIVTATDAGRIPAPVRKWLAVIELAGYSVEEKLDIAHRYLLTRPFDATVPASWLSPAPAEVEPAGVAAGPNVVADLSVSSLWDMEASPPPSPPGIPGEDWRLAACTGDVVFEAAAIRRVIEDHTNEAGVEELHTKLAALCRRVVERRPPGHRGTEMVTPAVVRDVLGDGETLPSAVRAAIARERRRLADGSSDTAAATKTNDWIACLEKLPWTRRSEAPSDLARARAALDAGHAGLDEAKLCILEHLAVRRRNPRSGAVLCLAGPPGVGKTSLAQCTAEALGRGFVRLACGGLRDESDLRGHNRTWKDAQAGWILRELRRVGSKDPVVVLDEIDKIGTAPAAVLLEVLDPAQHAHFRDAFVELPFDLSEVLFITTANEVSRIPPALRDRLEVVELPGYSENEKVAIGETHLVAAQNRAAGLMATPVRFTRGALRRIIREYTSEQGVRQFARRLQAICRKVALGLETGDASLVRGRVTVRQVHAFLGAPRIEHTDGVDRLGAELAAPSLPAAVRERGRQVLARLSAWSPADPEHARTREYQRCLAGVPWTVRAETTLDLARSRAFLDAGHAGHAAVKERLLDYAAVRLANPDAPSGVLCLLGPPGVGKSSLARLVAAALGRPCAWVDCGALGSAAAVHGSRGERPGRIVEALRRAGVRNPVFVLDEVDLLEATGGVSAALVEAVDPMRRAAFCDRYLELPFDLSEALFVATASRLGSVPSALRERMRVVELPGYIEAEKRVIAARSLLPGLLRLHGLTAGEVDVTDEAIGTIIRGYTREAGVWRLAAALGEVCVRVVRRRAEGDESRIVVTPEQLAGLLGAPVYPASEVAGRTGRPGVAVGLCWTTSGGGEVLFVEVITMAGSGALTLTGRQGEVMQESVRGVLSWLRVNAERYGVAPGFHRDIDIHLHVDEGPADGASAGVAMAAALVSALTGRVVRGDLAMTGEVTLSGQVLRVGGIEEKLLAAHRGGLAGVILPRGNQKEVDEDLGDELRRAVEVHYVTRVDELLELALEPSSASAAPAGRVS